MISESEINKITSQKLKDVLNTKIIYKYSNFETSLNHIILNKTLQFSNPDSFNDPFDCNEGLFKFNFSDEIIKTNLDELSNGNISRSQRRKMIKQLKNPKTTNDQFKKTKKEYKISCFSKLYDEVLMWSHYGNKHSGICVGFDFPYKYDGKFILSPVVYQDKIEPLDEQTNYRKVFLHWMTIKSIRWEYEKEIRAISHSKISDPYELMNYDKKYIKEIIFGCNVSKSKINEALRKIRKSDISIKNILFKRMLIDTETFLLKEEIIKP